MGKMHVKTGDTVIVIAGKEKAKRQGHRNVSEKRPCRS